MRCLRLSLLILVATLIGSAAFADEPTLQNTPPVVVSTSPEAGAIGVDPGTTELRVTFSKAMADASWSFVKVSDASFPQLGGQPSYLEGLRTCLLPVKLEAGKTYAVWVNAQSFSGFRDPDGRPAVPYLLVFETGR